jgi:hypothetical protein
LANPQSGDPEHDVILSSFGAGGYDVGEPLTDFERNNGQSGEWTLIMETPTETREYRTGLDSMNSPSKPIVDMAAMKVSRVDRCA